MAEDYEIVGKRKRVIDESAFFNAKRTNSDFTILHQSLGENVHHGTYFNSSTAVDKVRVVTARIWDYHQDSAQPFNNYFDKFKSFGDQPIEFHPPLNGSTDGSSDSDQEGCSAPWEDSENPLILHQTVVIKSKPVTLESGAVNANTMMLNWLAYVKAGLQGIPSSGTGYAPVIKADYYFHDHYHSTFIPFTPLELEKKQPAGKAYYADYKTYYNERLDSKPFESALASRPNINNSIPSIYGFLRLVKNDLLLEDGNFELTKLLEYMNAWRTPSGQATKPMGSKSTKNRTKKNVYQTLFQKYPLETAILLYGAISMYSTEQLNNDTNRVNNQILEKIISLDFSKHDASALFEDYFDTFSAMITGNSGNEGAGYSWIHGASVARRYSKIQALERIMSKIAFSPNFIPIMDKVDQYKKYFPYYVDLQFTAKRLTSIGDLMKDLFLTRYLSYKAMASKWNPADPHPYRYGIQDDWNPGGSYPDHWDEVPDLGPPKKFIEYSEEKIYKDIKHAELDYDEHVLTEPNVKKTLDLQRTMGNFIDNSKAWASWQAAGPDALWPHKDADYPSTSDDEFYGDVRNYVTFVRDDFKDPVKLISDENTVFRTLCGAAFYAKILKIYKNNRRSYFDILKGKPAYTEDVFYKIVKYKKDRTEGAEWTVLQEILIPNTSELDIARYVDTQLKYSDQATYKYDVYTLRAVFGSKYKYRWGSQTTADGAPGFDYEDVHQNYGMSIYSEAGALPPAPAPGQGFDFAPYFTGLTITENSSNETFNFIAKFLVTVEPSIQIIEDKLFSTPEVYIMDKPPMPPDVNIVPYRAVSDKLKFIFTGTSGRMKEKPILILNSDKEKFDLVKKSQLVFPLAGTDDNLDAPVEFANDDPVTRFQIFRTRNKPSSFQDFELYKDFIPAVFEETILPNTKYYYTFRAIDDHNHISNPSPIYEVELIDEKGAVKPLINLFNFEPSWPKTYMRECQKYIYIKPNLKQLYFSEDEEVDGIFSTQNKKKRYKLRLVSKGTGKKIDINFSYEKKIDEDQ